MTDLIKERLKAIREREQGALAGPWGHWPEAGEIEVMQTEEPGSLTPKDDGTIVATSIRPEEGWGATRRQNNTRIYRDSKEPTADFIAHSRTDVPWLIDLVETYRTALQKIGDEYITGVNEVIEESMKPNNPNGETRISQIRGGSLENISDIILDLEDDYLFERPEE